MPALGQEVGSLESLTCIFPYKGHAFAQKIGTRPLERQIPSSYPGGGRVLCPLVLLLPLKCPRPILAEEGWPTEAASLLPFALFWQGNS